MEAIELEKVSCDVGTQSPQSSDGEFHDALNADLAAALDGEATADTHATAKHMESVTLPIPHAEVDENGKHEGGDHDALFPGSLSCFMSAFNGRVRRGGVSVG